MVTGRKVTLNDVAARAGVSPTTASYILNGRSSEMRISADTEHRVRQAVSEMGYRPNRNARNLRTASTTTIGVISDFVASGGYAGEMLSGVSAAARAKGHLMVVGETEGDPALEMLLIEELLDRQVDGIIYVRLVDSQVSVPGPLTHRRTVLLNCVDPTTSLPAVLPDELGAGRDAARLLVRAGVAGEVYVVGEDPTPEALAGPLRLAGVRAELAESGRELGGVVACAWTVTAAYEAVADWLATGARPSAFMCLNDRVAMGTYQALAERGLCVPDDVAVVSYDGSELSAWLRPAVTSMALPFAALGARAVEILLGDPATTPVEPVLVPMTVRSGGSIPSAV